uniref:Uncharacterized protein n=1 Tax=Arundo donax TaxID=35708 RepID=A0A0A9EKU7_ARUDO
MLTMLQQNHLCRLTTTYKKEDIKCGVGGLAHR